MSSLPTSYARSHPSRLPLNVGKRTMPAKAVIVTVAAAVTVESFSLYCIQFHPPAGNIPSGGCHATYSSQVTVKAS